jgi:hypothetical protein
MISDLLYLSYEMYETFYGCSIAAKAVSAVSNCLTLRDIAARHAHKSGSLTNLHNFIALSHLDLSQKSNKIVG